jgi:mRNA interferase MazF
VEINQYQVVLVNLDPTMGSEMKKTRPCLVISPNEMNQFLQTIVIAPMTKTSKAYPTRVPVLKNRVKSWVVLDQIRTIDRRRIVRSYHTLTRTEISLVKKVLQESYVDD